MNKLNLFFKSDKTVFLYTVLIMLMIFFAIFAVSKVDSGSFFQSMELKTFDIRQSIIADNKKTSDDIVILTVDDESYEYLIHKYGEWPIPRYVYAQILDYVESQKPYLVGFDLLFVHSMRADADSDLKLANAFGKYKNAYTAINFDDRNFAVRKPVKLPDNLSAEVVESSNKFTPVFYPNCRSILSEIIAKTDNIGHINTPKSDDGITRTVPLYVAYPKYENTENNDIYYQTVNYYPYMTYKMAVKYLAAKNEDNFDFSKLSAQYKNGKLSIGGLKPFPITEDGQVILNWYGETGLDDGAKTFKYISLWKVVESMSPNGKKLLSPDTFKNKVVFVGTSVVSLSDIKSVPTAKYMPGVEIHATLFNNFIDNNFIVPLSNIQNIAVSVILSLAVAAVAFVNNVVLVSFALSALIILLYLAGTVWVMDVFNIWVWAVFPVILSIMAFISVYVMKYIIKSRDFEHTYKLATTDGLTELYNHRFFQDQMKISIEDCKRSGRNFSLIMVDIDFFKKFNDTYGHQAGDAVLRQVAATLKKTVRSSDIVCRYGGEEMSIILKDTGHEEAIITAEKVCRNVAARPFLIAPNTEKNVTISLGVSTYPENGSDPQELIEYADKGLYAAKENGRNQVGRI